jgi:hypothetical protein
MAAQDFIDQLRQLGYVVIERGGDRIEFVYKVETGKFAGQIIQLGFEVPGDFPLTPPSGPHLSPRLLPITNGGGSHPTGAIHPSNNFGPEWEYWSRPLKHWAETKRTVRDVLAHVRHLFDTQ